MFCCKAKLQLMQLSNRISSIGLQYCQQECCKEDFDSPPVATICLFGATWTYIANENMTGSSSIAVFLGVSSLLSLATCYHSLGSYARNRATLSMSINGDKNGNSVPTSSLNSGKDWTVQALKSLSVLSAVALPLLASTKAKAVGTIFELKDQNIVIQDITFNVANTLQDADAMTTLFQNNIRELRTSTANNQNVTVLGFGPDAYNRLVDYFLFLFLILFLSQFKDKTIKFIILFCRFGSYCINLLKYYLKFFSFLIFSFLSFLLFSLVSVLNHLSLV